MSGPAKALEIKGMKNVERASVVVTAAAVAVMLSAYVGPVRAQLSAFPELDEAVATQLGAQLSAVPHAAAEAARAGWSGWHERQRDLRDTRSREDQSLPPGGGTWGLVYYGSADHEASPGGVQSDYEQRRYGFSAGADLIAARQWVVGVTTGYTRATVAFDQLDTRADFDGVGVGFYASYFSERVYLDAMLRQDWHKLDIEAPALGIQSENDQLSTDVDTTGLHIEGGMRWVQAEPAWGALRLDPLFNLSWVSVQADQLNIPPQDPLTNGLEGNRAHFDDYDSLRAAIGGRVSLVQAVGGARLEHSLMLRYWHEFEREAGAEVALFDDDRMPVGEVTVADERGSGFADLGLGLVYSSATGGASAMLKASAQTGSGYDSWNVTTGIRYLW